MIALGGSLPAADRTAAKPWTDWSSVRYKVKLPPLFSGSVEMRIAGNARRRVLETHSVARFMGVRVASMETASTFDVRTGRILRYVNHTKKRGRRYLFGESGYSIEKLDANGDPERPLDSWEVTERQEFSYVASDDDEPVPVFDSFGLMLNLTELPLKRPGDEVVVYLATASGPVPYRIVVSEERNQERRYRDLSSDTKRKEVLRELRLRVFPVDPEQAKEGFLKMEGEAELWIEARSGTLVFLGGKVPGVPGRVRLVLAEIG